MLFNATRKVLFVTLSEHFLNYETVCFVLLLMCIGLLKGLREERYTDS